MSHPQHNVKKFFGHCNDMDRAMRACLKDEVRTTSNLVLIQKGCLTRWLLLSYFIDGSTSVFSTMCVFLFLTNSELQRGRKANSMLKRWDRGWKTALRKTSEWQYWLSRYSRKGHRNWVLEDLGFTGAYHEKPTLLLVYLATRSLIMLVSVCVLGGVDCHRQWWMKISLLSDQSSRGVGGVCFEDCYHGWLHI